MLVEPLNQVQIYGLIGFGAIFWFIGALTVRHTGCYLFANNLRRLSSYIAAIPLLYIAIVLSEAALGTTSKQRLISVVIMTATAIMLDGTALMWFPALYEDPTLAKKNRASAVALSRMGAAWILWGGGIGLVIALLA